jgi:DNA transformation protein and related proteins
LDALRRWAPVEARRMFGSHGLFHGAVLVGLIRADTLYLRTDDANRGDYERAGMAPFRYLRAGRPAALQYHEVPAEVIDDAERLGAWADAAYAAALRRAQDRRRKPARGRHARDDASSPVLE